MIRPLATTASVLIVFYVIYIQTVAPYLVHIQHSLSAVTA